MLEGGWKFILCDELKRWIWIMFYIRENATVLFLSNADTKLNLEKFSCKNLTEIGCFREIIPTNLPLYFLVILWAHHFTHLITIFFSIHLQWIQYTFHFSVSFHYKATIFSIFPLILPWTIDQPVYFLLSLRIGLSFPRKDRKIIQIHSYWNLRTLTVYLLLFSIFLREDFLKID